VNFSWISGDGLCCFAVAVMAGYLSVIDFVNYSVFQSPVIYVINLQIPDRPIPARNP
jgi:hypothetical protein